MCYEYELEYQLRRAEEARKELKQAEERDRAKIPAPREVPQEKPVPA